MDSKERRLNFIREFYQLEDDEVLSRLEELLYAERQKNKTSSVPMPLDELYQRVDLSMNDSNSNKLTEIDDLIAEVSKWS